MNGVENKLPKVSVIMAVYNCSDTIHEAIQSILEQTFSDWELVLCDDCSTDSTYSIIKEYERKYPGKIKALKNEKNSKLSYSLNHCLKYARGEYIARMDGDDKSMPERLEKQVEFLESHKEYSVVGTWMTPFDSEKTYKDRCYKEIPDKLDLLVGPCFAHATIMMRAEAYRKVNGYKVSKMTVRSQDYDMWFRFFAKGLRGYNLAKSYYLVREDEKAFTRRKFKVYWNEMKIRAVGFRLLKISPKYYIYVLKPLGGYIKSLIFRKIRK